MCVCICKCSPGPKSVSAFVCEETLCELVGVFDRDEISLKMLQLREETHRHDNREETIVRTPRGAERRVSAPFCSSTLKITPPTADFFRGGSAGGRSVSTP